MSLKKYWAKRDFKKTAEPRGREYSTGKSIFVVQKHHASHLHYDFRLELDGVLKSWAVPKGPSLNPKVKRLAAEVEDHPIDYHDFEGEIEEGEYGAGHVIVWDHGSWDPPEDALEQIEKGRLEFALHGEKLGGRWILVRTKGFGGKNSWLLIKRSDEFARSADDEEITVERPESVLTGRTVEEVEDGIGPKKRWKSNRKAVGGKKKLPREKNFGASLKEPRVAGKNVTTKKPVRKIHGKKAAMPRFVMPQLARLSETPPRGEGWIHEIKFDGYRMLCRIDKKSVKFISRNEQDWTGAYASLVEECKKLPIKNAIFDGEVVAIDDRGRSRFQELQNVLKTKKEGQLLYYIFDVIYLDGEDLRGLPLLERKERLRQVLKKSKSKRILFSDYWMEDGASVLKSSCNLELEGIISKRADQPYSSGRGNDWIKSKCMQGQEFVIGGYTEPQGSRTGFGALLLGAHDDKGQLHYVGRVGTGFNELLLTDLTKKLRKLEAKKSPFVDFSSHKPEIHWVKPQLVGNVEFTEWTSDGILRHPSFQGLRSDKKAKDVVFEVAAAAPSEPQPKPSRKSAVKQQKSAKKKSASKSNEQFHLTNPDKMFYPKVGVTKKRMAEFYQNIAKWMLPYVVDRPLALKRCPNGVEGHCFFQKHQETDEHGVRSAKVRSKDRGEWEEIIYIDDLEGLVELVQLGTLEIHVWGSRRHNIDRADQIVFDLDPAEDVSWSEIKRAALEVREVLENLGLRSFVKVTGGKGLHVQVPIVPEYTWEQVKGFSKAVVSHMAKQSPHRYTTNISIAKRKGKIFMDYLRNGYGATAVAAFSLRAKPNAPVALTLDWKDLPKLKSPNGFGIEDVEGILKRRKKDPWADYFKLRQRIKLFDATRELNESARA